MVGESGNDTLWGGDDFLFGDGYVDIMEGDGGLIGGINTYYYEPGLFGDWVIGDPMVDTYHPL